jgi:hypothetical protein
MPIIRIENPEVFVGLEASIAKAQIEAHGYECRIVHVDNRTLHADYKPDYDPLRCNLWVKAGSVVKAFVG